MGQKIRLQLTDKSEDDDRKATFFMFMMKLIGHRIYCDGKMSA